MKCATGTKLTCLALQVKRHSSKFAKSLDLSFAIRKWPHTEQQSPMCLWTHVSESTPPCMHNNHWCNGSAVQAQWRHRTLIRPIHQLHCSAPYHPPLGEPEAPTTQQSPSQEQAFVPAVRRTPELRQAEKNMDIRRRWGGEESTSIQSKIHCNSFIEVGIHPNLYVFLQGWCILCATQSSLSIT